MKRFLVACGLFCALMVGLWAVSAATNFSGTWVVDKSKTQGLQGPMADAEITWTVTQSDKELTIETKVVAGGQERPSQKIVYNLDGSETTQELSGRMTGKVTRKAKWMDGGKTLELVAVTKGASQQGEFTSTATEHWELADGGKTLKVHRKVEGPRPQEISYTFNKK